MRNTIIIIVLSAFVILAGCSSPDLNISNNELEFGASAVNRTFKLENVGGGSMDWRIEENLEWLSAMPFAGVVKGDPVSILVKADRSVLEPGKYTGQIKITSNGGDTIINVSVILLKKPVVELETSKGSIKLELYPDVAPIHVENFLNLAKSGFYDSLIFHRVIDGFMIQGGGFTDDLRMKQAPTIPAEFNDSLHHAGTLAMARRNDPNSASSQFYICLRPQPRLDRQYTVFGKTIEGFDVVQDIGSVQTNRGPNRDKNMMPDQPLEPVYIEKVNVLVDYEPIE